MNRYYYKDSIIDFLDKDSMQIFGEIVTSDKFNAGDLQKYAWKEEIEILKRQLENFKEGYILFEYTVPRIGDRIDCILLYKGIVFILEFKVGNSKYSNSSIQQVIDYALDLSYFHKESQNKIIAPILISTKAQEKELKIKFSQGKMLDTIFCNKDNIGKYIKEISLELENEKIEEQMWINSIYMPSPTIIEAAKALYRCHDVKDITRNDACAKNLNKTTKAINKIIDHSKNNNRKSICFVTGVPGSGKTLAGLNIAFNRQRVDQSENSVFISGNGPLVEVLKEALARDAFCRTSITKNESKQKMKKFIQIIHRVRDDALSVESAPNEKVVVFDEAQRAWNVEKLEKFMKDKKAIQNFGLSEPEFLISIMDRHEDWATIVCLIGGGQEINTGEAGLIEWFKALKMKFRQWDVYVSEQIDNYEYVKESKLNDLINGLKYKLIPDLHLSVSLRSFRSEKVSEFVKCVLDKEKNRAKTLYNSFKNDFPIFITRDINKAKNKVKQLAKGTQRYGLIASSGAKRLREYGIWTQNKIDAPIWFLNNSDDVRSSNFLEETGTEFDIQGLELDYTILCWDADFRYINENFECFNFKGTKWQNINKVENKIYLKNSYRVLMTRARQGMVIFIPEGNKTDSTRSTEFYDGTYNYFKEIGIEEI